MEVVVGCNEVEQQQEVGGRPKGKVGYGTTPHRGVTKWSQQRDANDKENGAHDDQSLLDAVGDDEHAPTLVDGRGSSSSVGSSTNAALAMGYISAYVIH